MNKSTELPKTYHDYQIKVSLNPCFCDKTFKDMLRTPKTGHRETLLAEVKEQSRFQRNEQSSIFGGEDNAKQFSHKRLKYVGSTVMFNDAYAEVNPRIVKWRTVRYKIENNTNRIYSDTNCYLNTDHSEKRHSVDKKLNNIYYRNPLEILNTEQTKTMNKKNRDSVCRRTEAIDNYLSSQRVKKTFKSLIRDPYLKESIAKVTNQDYKISASRMKGKRLTSFEDNHKTRHYRVASYDGRTYTYLK